MKEEKKGFKMRAKCNPFNKLHNMIFLPQFSYVLMVFNLYLPHISGKLMSEMIVLSIFSIGNVRIDKKKTNQNEKYEIVLHTPHFKARCL